MREKLRYRTVMPFDTDTPRVTQTGSALEKSVAVLDLLSRAEGPLGLSELADRLNLPRQTVHRILGQMEDLALIRRLPGREGFTVGSKLIDLGLNAVASGISLSPVRAILRDLVEAIGETCNLGVLDRGEVVYVDRVECDWPLRLQYGPGSRLAPHASAIGKLLLAHLPARNRRRITGRGALKAFTDATVTAPDRLEQQFKDIRKQGYAVNNQESVTGLMGLAVPVTDAGGKVIAGLAVHGPVARMSIEDAIARVPLFQRAAGELSEVLTEIRNGGNDNAVS